MTLTFDRPGQLERPDSDWTRDDDGRPIVLPDPEWAPEQLQHWLDRPGTKDGRRHYTRVTTFTEALLDGTMLARWKMRRVALGMGRRADYVVAAAALTAEDRDREALNDLAEKALEAAGPNAADIGTALHGFSERIDRGEPLGFVPDAYQEDLRRYRQLVEAHLRWKHREERMVCDALETAGTPDGIAWCDQPDPDGVTDLLRIVDLKTGNVERTAGKFSCQLGVYANSALYDPQTGKRTWLADLDRRWGLVLHMPAGVGTAELRWLNLEHGWLGAQLAGPVRRWRTVNHADLMRPLVPVERVVAPGKCRGVKRDGEPCTYNAKNDGLCTRHQGQDPDAAVPLRTQQVAADLRVALENVPKPLREPALPTPDTEQGEADAIVERETAALERPATIAERVEQLVQDGVVDPAVADEFAEQVAADLAGMASTEAERAQAFYERAGRFVRGEDMQRQPLEREAAALEQPATAYGPHRFAPDDAGHCVTCGFVRDDSRGEHLVGPIGGADVPDPQQDPLLTRCAITDLLPDQCACPVHRPDLVATGDDGVRPDEPRELPREQQGNPRPHSSMGTPEDAADASAKAELGLMDQVRACRTSGELEVLYQRTGSGWSDAVKKYASRHRQLLPELAQTERAGAAFLVAIRAAKSQPELHRLFTDPRNRELITDEAKQAARELAPTLPPF